MTIAISSVISLILSYVLYQMFSIPSSYYALICFHTKCSGLDMDDPLEDPCTPPGVCLDSSSTEDLAKPSNQMHSGVNGDLSFRTASNPDLNASGSANSLQVM